MQQKLNTIRDYFLSHPPVCNEANSVLDCIHWGYSQDNPIKTEEIERGFDKIRQQFPQLSDLDYDTVFLTVAELCLAHERKAFKEGMRLGISLMHELNES